MPVRRRLPDVSRALSRFVAGRDGATAIEYGLIAALVCLAVIGSMAATGDSVSAGWAHVGEEVIAAFNRN